MLSPIPPLPPAPDDIRAVDEAWGTTTPAHVPGHDGVGVVMKVGPGVSQLSPGDVVVPLRGGADFGGTWRTLAVVREDAVLRLPEGLGFPLEQAAWLRHYITAFRLLEGADLKVRDLWCACACACVCSQSAPQQARSARDLRRHAPRPAYSSTTSLGMLWRSTLLTLPWASWWCSWPLACACAPWLWWLQGVPRASGRRRLPWRGGLRVRRCGVRQ